MSPSRNPLESPRRLDAPLYGYRAWRLRGSGLYSFSGWRAWPADSPKVALCWRNFLALGIAHHAPGSGCNCGIYAWKEPPTQPFSPQGMTPVWGVVQLWGKVVLHAAGYRSQYARPVALEYAPGLEAVAARYRVILLRTLSEWTGP